MGLGSIQQRHNSQLQTYQLQPTLVFKGAATFQNWGVSHLSFQTPETSNYNGQRCRGRGMGGVSPSPADQGVWGRRELSERGLGRSPSRKRFWGVSYAICVRFHASFTAFNSCLETVDFYIPSLASRFDIPPLFLGGGVGHPRHPQWLRHCSYLLLLAKQPYMELRYSGGTVALNCRYQGRSDGYLYPKISPSKLFIG